jgi:hypothetical protein
MAENWTTLYSSALQSEPPQLLDTITRACKAMNARLRTLLLSGAPNAQSEREAIYLGLADLHVLQVSYQARRRCESTASCAPFTVGSTIMLSVSARRRSVKMQ